MTTRQLGRTDIYISPIGLGTAQFAGKAGRGVITVVPVTSNVAKIYPFQVFLSAAMTGLIVDSKAQAEQIRSVAMGRLRRRMGRLSPAQLTELDQALRLHLEL